MLVDGRWRLLQNCRVFRSAQFFTTDHRMLVATLKLRLRVPRRPDAGQIRLDVGRLRDPQVAEAYSKSLMERLDGLDTSGDAQDLWAGFRDSVLAAASDSIPRVTRGRRSVLSEETVAIIDESRKARLSGNTGQYRKLRREAIRAAKAE